MRDRTPPTRGLTDAVVVTIVCFGLFIFGSISAVLAGFPSGAFDDASFASLIFHEIVLGAIALAFLHYRGYPIAALIPHPTATGSLIGISLYAVSSVAAWVPVWLLGARDYSAEPIEQMAAGATIALPWLLALSVVNGLYEEVFLTGYLLPTLETFGATRAIGITALIRLLYHLYQGPVGAVTVLVFGIICAVYYWRTRKLWPVVFAHMFADVAGFALK